MKAIKSIQDNQWRKRRKRRKMEKTEKNKNNIKIFFVSLVYKMVNHVCPNCLKNFKRKVDLTYHMEKKKKPCYPTIAKFAENCKNLQELAEKTENNEKSKDNNSCKYCNKNFSSIYTLNRHLNNNCKIKKKQELNHKDENIKLKEEIEELKKLFYEFSKKKNKSISNQNIKTQNIITNTDNSNTQNIQNNNNINIILPHGKELENIGLGEVLDHMLTYNFREMIPNLVKHIYLNADKPENQNFVVNDLARNKCKYYNGEKWVTGKTNEKILCMFENTNSLFVDPFNEPEAKKTVEFIRKNKKYSEKYPTILKCKNYAKGLFNEWDKESMDLRQKILDELKIIFYNHKDEILEIEC